MPVTVWILTREAADAQGDRAEFDLLGLPVLEVPCLHTSWSPWPWAQAEGLTLFTSRRAVTAWERGGRAPLGAVAALSPGTSSALSAAGVTVSLSTEGGAVELAQALVEAERRSPGPFRYPTSQAGMESMEQREAIRLLSELGPVDRRVVYEVRAPPELASALEAATQAPWSVVFSSPSAVRHFFLAPPTRPPRQVVCVGRSTARLWQELRPSSWPEAVLTDDLRRTLLEVKP